MKFEPEKQKIKVLGVLNSKYPLEYKEEDYMVTEPRSELEFTLEGITGERHHGYETQSGNRQKNMYPLGSVVRNNRQWSAISQREIDRISKNLDIEEGITPDLLGINLFLDGDFPISRMKPMTYIVLTPHEKYKPAREEDVTLVVYAAALPCRIQGKAIANQLGDPSLENRFPKASIDLRGITGWVEKGGIVKPDYNAWIMFPKGID